MNKTILLGVGVALLLLGFFKPNLSFPINKPRPVDTIVVVTPPQDRELLDSCKVVIEALNGGSSDRKKDGVRLSEFYMDLATLIELDGDEEVVKTTEDIKQANGLCGAMLRMNIKGKYPALANAAQAIIAGQIGNDIVPLDDELRRKSVEAFKALAWACLEGSK